MCSLPRRGGDGAPPSIVVACYVRVVSIASLRYGSPRLEGNVARRAHCVGPLVAAWMTALGGAAAAGEMDLCVRLSDVDRGRDCGNADSVRVDVKNDCGRAVVGAVLFHQESGDPIRFSVRL